MVEFGPLGRLAAARGHVAQLYQYAALSAGAKPALDDWVDVERVARFEAACVALELVVVPDLVFVPAALDVAAVSPTTRAAALRWIPGASYPRGAQLHVFVARSEEEALHAWSYGWYPLLHNGTLLQRDPDDFAPFGRALGYPDCCVEAFEKHDWNRCNGYEVAFEASTRFDPVCFPFGRHTELSFIFHIPCRFDCPATARLATAVREWMPAAWARHIETFQREHLFVVWNEHRVYALRGSADDYEEVRYLGSISGEDRYGAVLRSGRTLRQIRDVVWVDGRIPILPCGFGPGPERPLLISSRAR